MEYAQRAGRKGSRTAPKLCRGTGDPKREDLRELLRELESVNDEYESIPYGMVRIIRDKNVLIVEHAVRCVLSPHSAPSQAYYLARDYAERYDPRYGTGLHSGLGATGHGHRGFLVPLLLLRPG